MTTPIHLMGVGVHLHTPITHLQIKVFCFGCMLVYNVEIFDSTFVSY